MGGAASALSTADRAARKAPSWGAALENQRTHQQEGNSLTFRISPVAARTSTLYSHGPQTQILSGILAITSSVTFVQPSRTRAPRACSSYLCDVFAIVIRENTEQAQQLGRPPAEHARLLAVVSAVKVALAPPRIKLYSGMLSPR